MEVLIVIIGIIISIVSTTRKNAEKKAAEEHRRAFAAARVQSAQQKQTPLSAPATPTTVLPPSGAAGAPGQVISPTVHAHIQPDCETHDVPGSLGVTSLEGKDPCHEEELTLERTFAEPSRQTGGLTFDWTGDSLVKAVVMQEVLTRPVNRILPGQRRAE